MSSTYLFCYAKKHYSHVVKHNSVTTHPEWAKKIKQEYDIESDDTLKKIHDLLSKSRGRIHKCIYGHTDLRW